MLNELQIVKFKHLAIVLKFYTDLYSKLYSFQYDCVYKTCEKCSETNTQHNYLVFSLGLS